MRRLGSTPAERGSTTGCNCPDIVELSNGDFYVIGKIAYLKKQDWDELRDLHASVGPDEFDVIIPRRVLLDAKADIPDE